MDRTYRRATRPLAALAAAASLALAACSDDGTSAADDSASAATTAAPAAPTTEMTAAMSPPARTDPAPSTEASVPAASTPGTFAPEFADYCALAVETADALPTPEQLEAYREFAPAEISEQVNFVVDALVAAGDDPFSVFADPAVEEALEPIQEFEARECGLGGEEGDDGPAQDPSVTALDPEANRVDVSATDFEFHADFPTTAGRYSFVMTNDGEAPHLMILVQLAEGATLDEVMASEGEEGLVASYESEVATAGGEAVITAELTPGNWIMICPIPGPGGKTHIELGMIHELTIT